MAKRPTDKAMLDFLEEAGTFDFYRVRSPDAAKNGDRWRWRPMRDGATAKPSDQIKTAPTLRAALAAAMGAPGGPAVPAPEVVQAKRAGFMFGFKAAAKWANRDDLIADIGSPAYERDCDAACGVALPDGGQKP